MHLPAFAKVTDLERGADRLRRARYGVVEMACGRLVAVHLRPWPRWASLLEVRWLGGWYHARAAGDRCWLYFNQPLTAPNYLAIPYVISSREGTLASFRGALAVLDAIARIKRSDALVCHVASPRISDRLLRRWGWQRHLPDWPGRHYIKRFYGKYPLGTPGTAEAVAAV